MIKEIKYNGYSTVPDDYNSPDGDMSAMLNIIPENGDLKPISGPKTLYNFYNKDVILQHQTFNTTNYILSSNNILYWCNVTTPQKQSFLHSFKSGIKSITSIGNSLVIIDGQGIINYFLWKENNYKYLGTQIPNFSAVPYLESIIYDSTEFQTVYGVDMTENSSLTLTEEGYLNSEVMQKLYDNKTTSIALYGESRQNVYNRVFATLNQYNKILKSKGFFTEPFYVRFAFRLFDGNYTRHTTPILMCPNSWCKPILSLKIESSGTTTLDIVNVASTLKADIELPKNINDWADIIAGISIFVTPPILDYTDNAESMVNISKLPYFEYDNLGVDSDGNELGEGWILTENGAPKFQNNEKIWQNIINAFSEQNKSTYISTPYSLSANTRFIVPKKGYKESYLAIDISTADVKLITDSGYEMPEMVSLPEGFPALPEGGQYKVYDLRGQIVQSNRSFNGYIIRGPRSLSSSLEENHHYIELKRTDGKNYQELLTQFHNFYNISEIKLEEFQNGLYTDGIPIKEHILENIETRPTLSDTGQSHSANILSSSFVYNNRLNVVTEAEQLPSCTPLFAQNFTCANGEARELLVVAYVKVLENSQELYYKLDDTYKSFAQKQHLTYFAYPKSTATELILIYSDWDRMYYVEKIIKLQRHSYLNLSQAFNNFNELEEFEKGRHTTLPTYPIDIPLYYNNKIKTSSINNPFIFKEENTTELPVTKVYALSSANRPLSQGQFGQYPLYAFTNNGIWALEVNNEGLYSARQPITRDVPLDINTITQIDNAVLFSTTRGIILLSGNETQCISEKLDGENFNYSQCQWLHKTIQETHTDNTLYISFKEYIKDCGMLYDYTHQRIIIYNKHQSYAYIFSLESKEWGIIESKIKSSIPSYPECLAMTHDNTLVDFTQESEQDEVNGYYISRPLTLDTPDIHKTITSIIQRGNFKKGHLNTILYGSRDLITWHPIYASSDHYLRGMRGTPYKYFRIAGLFNLKKNESISGCSVQYEERLTNKLR